MYDASVKSAPLGASQYFGTGPGPGGFEPRTDGGPGWNLEIDAHSCSPAGLGAHLLMPGRNALAFDRLPAADREHSPATLYAKGSIWELVILKEWAASHAWLAIAINWQLISHHGAGQRVVRTPRWEPNPGCMQ